MRAIIRYSIDGEKDNRLGNKLRSELEAAGFAKIGTASFEHQTMTMEKLAKVMEDFWRIARDPQAEAGAAAGASVDHVWTYAD